MMNKIKYLMLAMMAGIVSVSMTGCSEEDINSSNYEKYQIAVNEVVKETQKKSGNNKAILLVAFGSTWEQAYNAFDKTVESYQIAYPKYDVYLAFSSAICINRSAAGENVAPRRFYDPEHWLTAFSTVRYDDIVVQSLQIIPGEEYRRVRDSYIKDFANNKNGDVDDDYLKNVRIYLGTPLMAEEEDVDALAIVLNGLYASKAAQGVVAFMGHGNPQGYDYYGANLRYTQLEEALQKYSENYFVGTVDMPENFKTNVLARMQANGISAGKVFCHPLMSIAGDHAHNDMAGDDNDAFNGSGYDLNEEGEAEDTSWKMFFAGNGYTCNDDTQIVLGLLELDGVKQLWMNHTAAAIAGEPLDFYHSMNPE